MKRLFISFYLIFQAYYMLFAPISCDCKQTFSDIAWFIVVMGGIGIFCVSERDVNRIWRNIFKVTGYISFFFCAMFIVTFNNNLISSYYFNLSVYLIYIISIIYVLLKTNKHNDSRK